VLIEGVEFRRLDATDDPHCVRGLFKRRNRRLEPTRLGDRR
jgi:hypothetical protein